MKKPEFDQLLQKLAAGNLLPEEATRLREALAKERLQQREYFGSMEVWKDALNGLPPSPEEEARARQNYEALLKQLQQNETDAFVPLYHRRWWQSKKFRAACIIGVVIACGVAAFLMSPRKTTSTITATTQVWQHASTRTGERSKLTLSDGSVIYLNGGTLLKYPEKFSEKSRSVELLHGEIFLEIQPDKIRPFMVKTDSLAVQVLGTSFMVSNRPSDKQVHVAVKTGLVSFATHSNLQQLLLTPGKRGVFNKAGGNMEAIVCNKDAIAGWRKNEFIFEDATLAEVLTALENSYGYHYRIENRKLEGRRFRASFSRHTPQEMINALSRIADFQYIIKDSTIIIK